MKRLKYEADAFGAHSRPAIFVQIGQVGSIEDHMTARRQIQAGQQRQQRGLAGARRPNDGDRFARDNIETHIRKNGQTTLRAANLLC